MIGLPAVGALMGMLGVLCAAVAVFLSGPRPVVQAARALGVGSIAVGAAGMVQGLVQSGFQFNPSQGGQGSLLATGGMLLLTFGAARSAERKRLQLERDRRAEARQRKSGASSL